MATQNRSFMKDVTGVTVFLDGKLLQAPKSHASFDKIMAEVRKPYSQWNVNTLENLFDLRKAVVSFVASNDTEKDFTMNGDFLCLSGKPFTIEVTEKVLAMIEAGNAAEPIYRFLRKVRQNPLVSAQDELLLFCVANGFMIHEDGDIIAYKSVNGDYSNIYNGAEKFYNTIGSIQKMDRTAVDPNREQTCSVGLHFAAHSYASTWAGQIDGVKLRLMVIKVNPADVVAVPSDYQNQKGRTWRYEVIAELDGGAALQPKEVYSDDDFYDEDEDEDYGDVMPTVAAVKPSPSVASSAKVASVPQYAPESLLVWNDGGMWRVQDVNIGKTVAGPFTTREQARQAQRGLYGR